MIPAEIRDLVRSQIQNVLDLRLLRGGLPWSLAGSDGSRRTANLLRREDLVSRINTTIGPKGWTADVRTIRSIAGRTNKLELVLTGPGGVEGVWSW
jgi:hypothetical protein